MSACLCGNFATDSTVSISEMLRRSKIALACCRCERHSSPRRRASAHCFLGRFLPKLRRCQKHRRFFRCGQPSENSNVAGAIPTLAWLERVVRIAAAAIPAAVTAAATVVGPGRIAAGARLIPGAIIDVVLIAGRSSTAALPPGPGIDIILARRRRRRPRAARLRAAEPAAAKPASKALMRRKQAHERVAGDHATRHASRCRQRRTEEPRAAALLEHALLIIWRILRRRGGRLLIIWLLRLPTRIAGLAPCRFAAPARIALRRPRLRPISAAAEQPAEEAAAGFARLLRLLGGLLGLLQFPLQPLDAVLRLHQSVLLHEGELGDAVACLGILGERLPDKGVGLPVDWRQAPAVSPAPIRRRSPTAGWRRQPGR